MNKENIMKISLEIFSLLLIAAAFFFAVSGSMGDMNAGQSEQDGTESKDELQSSFAEDTDKEEENASQSGERGENNESVELSQDATEATVGVFEINRYKNERTAVWDKGRLIDAPYINQKEDFPNGCESVSAVMALQYLGVDIDAHTFIEEYLDMGSSPYYVNLSSKSRQ